MNTEIVDYTKAEVLTGGETEAKAEAPAEIETEAKTAAETDTETTAETDTETEAETQTIPETERKAEVQAETEARTETEVRAETETSVFPAFEDEKETNSSELSSDLSDLFEQMDTFPYSETSEEVLLDWQEDLSACRASLDSLVSLLLFGDIALCLLLGCLCASIFSAFWKVNR